MYQKATHGQLFSGSENVSLNDENVSLDFDFHSLPSTSSDLNNDYQSNSRSTPLRPVNIEIVETEIETQPTQQDDFQFLPPTWSKKNDIIFNCSPFTSPEGPTILINSNKQYMPKKPIKRGFKIWCLVDKRGYLWNFEIYTGKVGEKAEKQLGARVVKQLSQPLQEKNHCLFFDNYFTSYPLMTYLKSKNINACGTVNLTRKFLPALKNDKHLTLGEYDWSIDEKSTSIVKWRDKRIVSLLSNFHNPTETTQVQRRSKDGSITMVSCPIVLSEYNKHMNCVDKFDQNKKSCQIDRKAKKWWHRLFFHFIEAAVVNSHVLYKLQSGNYIAI